MELSSFCRLKYRDVVLNRRVEMKKKQNRCEMKSIKICASFYSHARHF